MNKLSVDRAEKWFFAFVVAAHAWPLLCVSFFPTLDGPAHVYNAKIITEILFHSGSGAEAFYTINANPVPNLSSHVILALLHLIAPGRLAEKLLQVMIIIAIPVAFRYFLKKSGAKSSVAVYLIFPFTYSFFFFYGFYNFCLSLAILFFAMGTAERFLSKSPKHGILLLIAFCGLILYFSHLLTFAVFCVYVTARAFVVRKGPKDVAGGKNLALYICGAALLPGLILAGIFLLQQDSVGNDLQFNSFAETASMYMDITPAKGILYGKEAKYTRWVFYTLVFMPAYSLLMQFRRKQKLDELARLFALLFVGFFALSFAVPNEGLLAGGILTSRIVLFALVFLIAFLAKSEMHVIAQAAVLFVITYVNISCLLIYVGAAQREQEYILEIASAAELTDQGAVVLPFTSTDFWIREHYSNYLGYDKPLVVLENYEASLNYFPVNWTPYGQHVAHVAHADWEQFRLSGALDKHPDNVTRYVLILLDAENLPDDLNMEIPSAFRELSSSIPNGVGLYEMVE